MAAYKMRIPMFDRYDHDHKNGLVSNIEMSRKSIHRMVQRHAFDLNYRPTHYGKPNKSVKYQMNKSVDYSMAEYLYIDTSMVYCGKDHDMFSMSTKTEIDWKEFIKIPVVG